ncbi:MAG: YceI family protein [Bdellovibrionales bacterium]|nr:YceI family protein [Bdellovibrionales bacterium]
MKCVLALALALATPTAFAANEKLSVKAAESSLHWLGKKVTGQHEGTIDLKSGTLEMKDGMVVGGSFTVDMTSLKVIDIQDPADNGKLTGHLKSDDFFSVAKNQRSTFKITKVEGDGESVTVTGDLTIKGVTHPISFPAKVMRQGKRVEATASFPVDRTKYGIRYGSPSFFNNLGDKAINNEFQVSLKLVASK